MISVRIENRNKLSSVTMKLNEIVWNIRSFIIGGAGGSLKMKLINQPQTPFDMSTFHCAGTKATSIRNGIQITCIVHIMGL